MKGGPPVGLFPALKHNREIIDIEPGSVIVIYSDGVSEAEDADEEQFDMDRFSIVLRKHCKESAKQIHNGIRDALKEFVGDNPANDDSTMMVLKF